MTRAVHIVAVAARTPVGLTAETSAAAVRARVSRLTLHPFMVDAAGNKLRCGRDASLDSALLGAPRIAALARAGLREILTKLARRQRLSGSVDVALALPELRPGFGAREAEAVVREVHELRVAGVEEVSVAALGSGHAGALEAIAVAARAVALGKADLCIVGGADSYLEADTLDWLDADKRLAREGVRGGFPPGEAAGFVALASDGARQELQLPSLARLIGSSIAHERRSWDSDEGLMGEGLTQAILQASAGLALPHERVGDIYCDINGERLRTDDWGLAILRTQQMFRDASAYITCVGEWGDIGAATGALGCVLAVQSWRRGSAAGERAMVWGASWGALRAACVLERGAG